MTAFPEETRRETTQAGDEGRDERGRLAEARLRCSSYLALRGVSCEFRDGVLYLRGRLPTYYLKQVAQAVVGDVQGVRRVVNLLEVRAGPWLPTHGTHRPPSDREQVLWP